MALDPRTPVVIGTAAVSERRDDPVGSPSAIDLMARACEAAFADAGVAGIADAVGAVYVPKGSWRYVDPAGQVARRIGAGAARSVEAELGILQTTLFRHACDAIASGALDVAVVVGGEAKWRELRAAIAGVELADDLGAGEPDERLAPHGTIVSADEIRAGLVTAVSQYSMLENAKRAADGQSLDEHAHVVASLWARFNEVARDRPEAWNRAPMSAEDIRTPGPKNRPLAFPYNKWHNSQWNVDQAACLVFASVEWARSHGVAPERVVHPHAIVDSEHMVPVSNRALLHRSPGFRIAGERAFALAGTTADAIGHVDLYSCFPIAVRVQANELGLSLERPLTITGGMTFGGGPLNNYVLQSASAMVRTLRDDPGSRGLVTAISGMITKQGVSVWSTDPPADGYRSADVTDEAARETPTVDTVAPTGADGEVATYTVLFDGDAPVRAVALVDVASAGRMVATSDDAELAAAMTTSEWCGRRVRVDDDGRFSA
jgi:acetyl-CoA C-acetyltransferase